MLCFRSARKDSEEVCVGVRDSELTYGNPLRNAAPLMITMPSCLVQIIEIRIIGSTCTLRCGHVLCILLETMVAKFMNSIEKHYVCDMWDYVRS
ncbi:hypothetical protein M514_02054 [Trichuris suis]|uniref:Uncharacterized protein n=1 Tax=Trichuris suis TaxID=68888 RepID=A0A085N2C1_9BILA|nr:hypothetical protein M513_02054 [Trichuris suis]KFD63617.1 hypothetical protein M514_02054 [Trichuris suis]